MLQTQTIAPDTFSLLKALMVLPDLGNFCLVGGTALSLQFGHRLSDDLDLFSVTPFENSVVTNALVERFGNNIIIEQKPVRFGIFCFIHGVKVDIVRHPHPLIRPIQVIDGIRMFSLEDIAAMKIQAILGRGKKKDFWDIAELLHHITMEDFVQFHRQKYSAQNLLITVPQAMAYFDDAEDSEDPISLKKQHWTQVKAIIRQQVSDYLR